jgi:hypothetical protein
MRRALKGSKHLLRSIREAMWIAVRYLKKVKVETYDVNIYIHIYKLLLLVRKWASI